MGQSKEDLKIRGLIEAIPYIRKFSGKYMVIKYGGSIMEPGMDEGIVEQIVFLKKYMRINIMVVHGGAKAADDEIKKKGLALPHRIDGKRYTSPAILKILEKCFGELNGRIVSEIKQKGGCACSFHGKGGVIMAKKDTSRELGLVGKVVSVDIKKLKSMDDECIPVISSIGKDRRGQTYNINADDVASAVAKATGAVKLIVLTDVPGIRTGRGDKIYSSLTVSQAEKLIKKGVVRDGMVPKLKACISTVKGGVAKSHIIKGAAQGTIIKEILSKRGVGTQVVR